VCTAPIVLNLSDHSFIQSDFEPAPAPCANTKQILVHRELKLTVAQYKYPCFGDPPASLAVAGFAVVSCFLAAAAPVRSGFLFGAMIVREVTKKLGYVSSVSLLLYLKGNTKQ
jgi:hypothetical protein